MGAAPDEDPELLAAFVEATLEVFRTMAGTEVFPRPGPAVASVGDLVGTVRLGGGVEGYLTVRMGEPLARLLVSRITGVEPGEVQPPDLHDGVGECANMIAGGAKAALGLGGRTLDLSLPSVGAGVPVPSGAQVKRFEVEGQSFSIHVELKENSAWAR